MIRTSLCKERDFRTDWFNRWIRELKETPNLHRKQWEFAVICQALFERGLLTKGNRGLGFGVGTEPLPSLFVKYGCDVVVTDLDPDREEAGKWRTGDQLLEDVKALNERQIASDVDFKKHVKYLAVDMNDIPDNLRDFNFTWSACSMDHLGSLEKSKQFMINQMDCLKDGGWAVHTSEFNVGSNEFTLEEGNIIIFRRKDLVNLVHRLEREGYGVEALNLSLGNGQADKTIAQPPYEHLPHIKLNLAGYTSTSFVIVVHKGPLPNRAGLVDNVRNAWYRFGQ